MMYRPAQKVSGGVPPQSSVKMALFSARNRDALINTITADVQRSQGQPVNERQGARIVRALEHYMKEVYSTQGDKPVPVLNREIIRVTEQDFNSYVQRQEVVRTAPQNPVQTVASDTLFQDTSTRFEKLQQDRQEVKAIQPAMPDFRIQLDDDGPSSVDLYEKAKRQREAEALRLASAPGNERLDPGIQRRIAADDDFRAGQAGASKATDLALVERQSTVRGLEMPLIVPPDRRELMLSSNVIIDPTGSPRDLGQGNSNPTITYPHLASEQKTNLSQDVIIRQDNVVSYKEVENNLFLYSADRNWLQNMKENRYNFTVIFNPGNNGNIQGQTQQVQEKFRNITRIELVKAILPIEGLDTLVRVCPCDPSEVITDYQTNVLSMPYVTLNIEELENNNYGTDNILDRSFGVLQYDANWSSDPRSKNDSRGYTAFIPKFLKCQKVYDPTPLSTLQKLSINILRPNGAPLSTTADALDILNIFGAGTSLAAGSEFNLSVDTNPKYFFIMTNKFFSRFQFSVGDNIAIANFAYIENIVNDFAGLGDFVNWINDSKGHLVAGIGHHDGTTYHDGANSVGYANCIVINARYNDPTSGSTDLMPFGPSINEFMFENTFNLCDPRRVINLSRQIQLVFRIITREMDGSAYLRPDNL